MDWLLYIKFLSGFVFVIALMLLLSWVPEKTGLKRRRMLQRAGKRRLKVVEFLPIDHKLTASCWCAATTANIYWCWGPTARSWLSQASL